MNFLHAILLGLIQGLTEFFPISSSAHLKITKLLLGIDSQRDFVLFDLSCHLGTLIAIIIYFKTEIVEMLCRNPRKVLPFFFATLPLIPAYFLLKPFRELASQTQYLGYCLLGTSIILYLGNRLCLSREKKEGSIQKLPDVLLIGVMQSAALIPGISRSASTISCAKVLGWSSDSAVRFSFLLSIPTVIGGNVLELAKISSFSHLPKEEISICCVAFLTSLICGVAVIKLALNILSKGILKPFAVYCAVLGIFVLTFIGR